MNGNQNTQKVPESSSHGSLSTTDILIQELRACMDALFEEQSNTSSESEGSDYESCVNYTWLADSSADRKSTRLNSSHTVISYAVFCLKKKKKKKEKKTKKKKKKREKERRKKKRKRRR